MRITRPAGDYDLIVCANAVNNVCPLDPDPLPLKSGIAFSVFAVGSLAQPEGAAALTAVVVVDGTAAKAPATDTETTSPSAWMLVLVGAGLLGLVASRRFATARAAK